MKTLLSLAAVAALAIGSASAGTLDDVKAKGYLDCAVSTGLIGFAAPDDKGDWTGFDIDMCRAVAVAIFGDKTKVKFTPTTGKSRFPTKAHIILPEIISKEPLGPVVRHGDNQWGDLVRWTLNAMIIAEELGVTSENVDEMKNSKNPEIQRLLGVSGEYGEMLGLSKDWAYNVIKAIGNYGESFDRHLGPDTAIGLERGLNALWSKGGILYAPPFR